jgi:hypothetical protein
MRFDMAKNKRVALVSAGKVRFIAPLGALAALSSTAWAQGGKSPDEEPLPQQPAAERSQIDPSAGATHAGSVSPAGKSPDEERAPNDSAGAKPERTADRSDEVEAETATKQVPTAEPDVPGMSDSLARRYRQVIASAEEASRADPGNAHAHFMLGRTRQGVGDFEGAIAALDEAVRLRPDRPGYHIALGDAYRYSGDRQRAGECYRKALAIVPGNKMATFRLAALNGPVRPEQKEVFEDPRGPDGRPAGFVAGAHLALFLPFGTWINHPYAGRTFGSTSYPDDLDLLGPGGGGIIEIGWKWRSILSLALQADLTTMATGEWESQAARAGSDLSATALQWDVNLMLGTDLFYADPFRLEARFGAGYMHAWVEEESSEYSLTYSYDALGPVFSLRLGLGGSYTIASGVDAVLMADTAFGLAGADYPGRPQEPYLGVTLALGVRFWPGLMGGR